MLKPHSKSLKNSREFEGVFIPTDRSREERMERRRLVQLLREKKQNEPEKHHYTSAENVINTRNNIKVIAERFGFFEK